MPELTVFITTFNRCEALASTLEQISATLRDQDVEILVFDDASTDATPGVCELFAGRVRVIRSASNIGYIRARNLGVRESASDLILFLDDDSRVLDACAPLRIAQVMNAHPDCAVIAGNIASKTMPAGLDDPTAAPYAIASYIGCGHVLRRSALPAAEAYAGFLNGYGGEETALSLALLDAGRSVVFDPGLRIHHAEDPSQRPAARRLAGQFINEIGTLLALFPAYLWLPLAVKKFVSHWRRNWKGDAASFLRLVVRDLPPAARVALRERHPVRLRTLRKFALRRDRAIASQRRWQESARRVAPHAESPLRVLHVIPSIDLEDGGPAVAIRGIAESLSAAGAEVSVATTHARDASEPDQYLGGNGASKVTVHSFPRAFPARWKYSPALRRWLAANISRFDVVHVHALFSYATIPGCRLARDAGVPYVLRPLGTLDAWSMRRKRWRKASYYALIERDHLRHAAAIHVTSASERSEVEARGFGARVRLIPHGVSVDAVVAPRARTAGSFEILFLSRLQPTKGLDLLLDAISIIGDSVDLHLTIAGRGSADYEASLRRRTTELGLQSKVSFAGYADDESKTRLMSSADAFVLPSYHENFGLAAAEAIAHGIPTIVSEHVGISEQLLHDGAALVVPCSAQAIADALREIAANPAAARVRAIAGVETARRRYSWQSAAQELVRLYNSIRIRS